jgi:hypothetical protein
MKVSRRRLRYGTALEPGAAASGNYRSRAILLGAGISCALAVRRMDKR